jgi:hypothetical protein
VKGGLIAALHPPKIMSNPYKNKKKREGYIFISSSKATGLAGTELA